MRPSAAAMERVTSLSAEPAPTARRPRRLVCTAAVLAALLALSGAVYASDLFGVQDWIQRTYARTGVDLRGAEIVLEGGELIVQKGAETAVFTGDPAWMLEHVLEIVEKDGQTVLHFGDRSFVLTGVVGPNAAAQAEFSFTENGEACRIVVQYEVFDGERVLYCGRVYMDGKYYGFGQARG